ncbi:MAG: NADP oxidoreductase [Acidobacteria bacterium]|nr:MAG: NADP oxidoreductase [Acidobacteriota bacterium]
MKTLRVAIFGAGPAGFYLADHLLRATSPEVSVDLFERLPAPFGLVRYGVAPDHQKIKNVTKVFERIAEHPRCRFFGNVEYGRDLDLDFLFRHYHQVAFATGAQTDRAMGIPGEDLERSHAATEFVAWYNGHPDYRDRRFDLSVEKVAVVGVGNVAVDVARILCRSAEELARTDIADHALEALRSSRVREIYVLGRRGPAQGAFSVPELRELAELATADVLVPPEEAELDPVSRDALRQAPDRDAAAKVELVQQLARRTPSGRPKRLTLRFCVSPVALEDDGGGRVGGMRIVRNELYRDEQGRIRPRPTDRTERLDVQLVFRSVGYRVVPLPGLPFDESRGVVPSECGRVTDGSGAPLPGLYVAGWLKRGPTGVIGTNKPDAAETAQAMLEDAREGRARNPESPDPAEAERAVRRRQPRVVDFDGWRRIDRRERELGAAVGRPRVKLTTLEEMLAAAEGAEAAR